MKFDAAGVVLDLDLPGTRRRHLYVLVGQHFGTARLVYPHRCDHCCHSLFCLARAANRPAAAMSLRGARGSSRQTASAGDACDCAEP